MVVDGTINGLVVILALSTIIQFVVEQIKGPIPEAYRKWAVPLLALGISVIVTLGCKVGLLATFHILINPPIIDYILTGVLISGGSTFINELIKVLQGIKETYQVNLINTETDRDFRD